MVFDSPFTRYLYTNYVPRSHEIPIIKAILEDHQSALRDLLSKRQIIDEETPDDIYQRSVATDGAIRSHQDFIRLHSALLSPVRDLPLDVLANVFTFSLELYEEARGCMEFKKMTFDHPIVNITHVCHEWRELAVGIPSLWRHVHIDSLPRPRYNGLPIAQIRQMISFNRSVDLITERVTIFLSRAAPLPIVLSCAVADPHALDEPNFQMAIAPLVNILRTAMWQDVSFRLGVQTSTSPLLRLLPIPAKSVATIRSLKVRGLKSVLGESRVFPVDSLSMQHLQVIDLDCSGAQTLRGGQ